MSKIVILDEKTANQIAAGEVIERPASVIKEMAENAVDAGATAITVEIRNGGISYIRVTDNGSGMESDDVEMAFERHATSKIRRIEDLDTLSTLGFRGEALASIASVSHLEVRTKTKDAQTGTLLRIEGGKVMEENQTGCPIGTSFIMQNLFYNTPARYKFLKKDSTEAGYVSDMMVRLALAHPEISFKFISNNQVQHHTPGNNDLISVIYSIYGNETAKLVVPISYDGPDIKVSGFIGKPEIARGTRSTQSFFLNGRTIRNKIITSALEDAYKTVLMQNKFPFCVINLKLSPQAYDVNVHPQKLEVRFSNESAVYSAVYHAVKDSLADTSLIRESYSPPVPVSEKSIVVNEAPGMRTGLDSKMGTGISPSMDVKPAYRIPSSADYIQAESPATIFKELKTILPNKMTETDGLAETVTNEQKMGTAEGRGADILLEADIVGQVFDTYIILQHSENMYLIDQHAAHERIRYEHLRSRILEGKSCAQVVLEPYVAKLSALEYDFLFSRKEAFDKTGFDIEAFGPQTIIIRSIPDIFEGNFSLSDFHEILDRWMETPGEKTVISDEAVYMMACKSAIKANRSMHHDEIAALVKQLCTMDNPYTCVHGRPVIVSISRRELEKRFKRIV